MDAKARAKSEPVLWGAAITAVVNLAVFYGLDAGAAQQIGAAATVLVPLAVGAAVRHFTVPAHKAKRDKPPGDHFTPGH
jgi:hypothetical protein